MRGTCVGSFKASRTAAASKAAAILRSVAIAISLAAVFSSGLASSSLATESDGVTTAIEIETVPGQWPSRRLDEPVEAQVRPHWCASTGKLVDDIHKLGGQSVMRLELDGGRALERYWNASEEVVIEHDRDGNSCLVDIRPRSR